jgi:hypothetical protein
MSEDQSRYNDTATNLEQLAEEANEIGRIKSKCMRFGLDDFHPKNLAVNRKALAHEIGHLLTIVDILIENKTIDAKDVFDGRIQKRESLKEWYKPLVVK